MQPRRVILTIETDTEVSLGDIKAYVRRDSHVPGAIKQVQVNVVKQPKSGKKRARR